MTRTALVTGASTGIGRAVALDLDRRGFRVFAGVRSDGDAAALADAGSERITPLHLDVTDPKSLAEAARAVGDGELHGLVNNAGIALGGVGEFIEIDEIRRLFEVNVFGLLATTRALLPAIRRGGGRVVHIGSMGGFLSSPFLAPYSATKHAVEAFADGLRRELRPWGLHVALIEPGSIQTPIWEKGVAEAQRMRRSLPPEGEALYGEALDAYVRYARASGERGVPAQRVADAVRHALTAARPRTRYRVGPDAKLMWWLRRLLPDRTLDRLVARRIGLPKHPPAPRSAH